MQPTPDSTAQPLQWLFPISALSCTPTAQDRSLHEEMYDRSRGIEFLYRLGTSIGLHSPGLFTAATWFHRFFMRYSMIDYHRQTVAAACIFLATKTEECGRNSEMWPGPHADLVDLFDAHDVGDHFQDYAWSIAHDSYRTPLCVLYPPKIIATACYILSQRIVDGPHSLSLDARVSPSPPSASLPTPPTHKPASPDASRFAIEFFGLNENELITVAGALAILLNFYEYQAALGLANYLDLITNVNF
ncbi:cyclin-like protein [Lactifluus volemus]|nr:cyclin-like protein [Lactifluus volemus]